MSFALPTCVLQILIDPLSFTYLTIFGFSPLLLIFGNYFSPFVINDHKRLAQILRLCETMISEDHLPKFGSI
jgi:hypothetical protein